MYNVHDKDIKKAGSFQLFDGQVCNPNPWHGGRTGSKYEYLNFNF